MNQENKTAFRRVFVWSFLSYIPIAAGIAWFAFAWSRWWGRGPLLATSGLLIGLSAGSALYLPVLRRLVPPSREMWGISVSTFTYLSVSAAIALALVLVVVAFAVPLK